MMLLNGTIKSKAYSAAARVGEKAPALIGQLIAIIYVAGFLFHFYFVETEQSNNVDNGSWFVSAQERATIKSLIWPVRYVSQTTTGIFSEDAYLSKFFDLNYQFAQIQRADDVLRNKYLKNIKQSPVPSWEIQNTIVKNVVLVKKIQNEVGSLTPPRPYKTLHKSFSIYIQKYIDAQESFLRISESKDIDGRIEALASSLVDLDIVLNFDNARDDVGKSLRAKHTRSRK